MFQEHEITQSLLVWWLSNAFSCFSFLHLAATVCLPGWMPAAASEPACQGGRQRQSAVPLRAPPITVWSLSVHSHAPYKELE